jgi:hypothetical protein
MARIGVVVAHTQIANTAQSTMTAIGTMTQLTSVEITNASPILRCVTVVVVLNTLLAQLMYIKLRYSGIYPACTTDVYQTEVYMTFWQTSNNQPDQTDSVHIIDSTATPQLQTN